MKTMSRNFDNRFEQLKRIHSIKFGDDETSETEIVNKLEDKTRKKINELRSLIVLTLYDFNEFNELTRHDILSETNGVHIYDTLSNVELDGGLSNVSINRFGAKINLRGLFYKEEFELFVNNYNNNLFATYVNNNIKSTCKIPLFDAPLLELIKIKDSSSNTFHWEVSSLYETLGTIYNLEHFKIIVNILCSKLETLHNEFDSVMSKYLMEELRKRNIPYKLDF